MSKAVIFITTGFEETEALTTADILRRGEVELTIASLTGSLYVTGSHGITVKADKMFDEAIETDYDMLISPGGPGTNDYYLHKELISLIRMYDQRHKYVSAICAAPVFLGKLGLLQGKEALCYPAMSDQLFSCGAKKPADDGLLVITDGNYTTSLGPGTTAHFALRLLEILVGSGISQRVRDEFI